MSSFSESLQCLILIPSQLGKQHVHQQVERHDTVTYTSTIGYKRPNAACVDEPYFNKTKIQQKNDIES